MTEEAKEEASDNLIPIEKNLPIWEKAGRDFGRKLGVIAVDDRAAGVIQEALRADPYLRGTENYAVNFLSFVVDRLRDAGLLADDVPDRSTDD